MQSVFRIFHSQQAKNKLASDHAVGSDPDSLESAFIHMSAGLAIYNAEGRCVSRSGIAHKILDNQDVTLKTLSTGQVINLGTCLSEVQQTGISQTIKATIIEEGQRRIIELTLHSENKDQVLILIQDVTRYMQESAVHRRMVESYRILMEQLQSAVAIYDKSQKLVFYNSAFSRLWRLEETWLNTRPSLGDVFEKLRSKRLLPEQSDFASYKHKWMGQFTDLIEPEDTIMARPDNIMLRVLIVPLNTGDEAGLIHIYEDITSRLTLESSVKTLSETQSATLDNLGEGVMVFGGDGRLKLMNPALAEKFEMDLASLGHEPHIRDLIPKFKNAFASKNWGHDTENIFRAFALERMELSGRMSIKKGRILEYASVALPEGACLITMRDISDSIAIEQALRDKNEALSTAERLKNEFLATISYELRTPLSTIVGFSDMLAQEYFGTLNKKQHEHIETIQASGAELKSLIDDIIEVSAIEGGTLDLEMHKITISDIVNPLRAVIKVTAKSDVKASSVKGDREKLAQVLISLTHIMDGEARLLVTKEKRQVIFDIKSSLKEDEKKKRASVKSDVSLTLARRIVDLHNGVLDIVQQKEGIPPQHIRISLPLV